MLLERTSSIFLEIRLSVFFDLLVFRHVSEGILHSNGNKKSLARGGALFVSYEWLHKTGFNEELSYRRTFVLYVLWPLLHTTYNHEAHYEITYSWLLQYLLMSKIIDFFIAYITMLSSAVISYRRDQALSVTTDTCYEEK